MGFCGIKVSKIFFEMRISGTTQREILVVFRLVVFRPFTSEVVIAKVKSSDEDGIRRALFSDFI